MADPELRLCYFLRDHPYNHNLRYNDRARQTLQQTLFRSLIGENDEVLRTLFGGQTPGLREEWSLSKAQGMTEDVEYTEAARGKPCGHIFKYGDAVFRCKTCTTDETAVLCTRCFEASDHTGHVLSQSMSSGNSGCCDCGDDEAWQIPVRCAIHSMDMAPTMNIKAKEPCLPNELQESIKMTIARAMDYLLDVISCSPENLRRTKSEEIVREDERQSRLGSSWYADSETLEPEFAVVLWNDEKHTVLEVADQVARACKKPLDFGRAAADTTNDNGRAVIEYSTDLSKLLRVSRIIEQIKITVTVRSSRDTFREDMCGTIIEWLKDIAGCSVGPDHSILRESICNEILGPWRPGSEASNKFIGRDGLDDHDAEEHELSSRRMLPHITPNDGPFLGVGLQALARRFIENDSDSETNDGDGEDDNNDRDRMDIDIVIEPQPVTPQGQSSMVTNAAEDTAQFAEAAVSDETAQDSQQQVSDGGHHHQRVQSVGSQISRPFANISFEPFTPKTNVDIPVTPSIPPKKRRLRPPPPYWLQQPQRAVSNESVPLCEDLSRRIRLDWLMLYDLRLWKRVRIDLRDLYITTLIAAPATKRIFGLRFAGLYSVLGQLYLIADREPDYSIINMSVQTFTTPSVTEEVIERGNFLTTLFSMLYTFLTQRSVQHPWQVSVDDSMASDNNSVSNRRMYHFFQDLKHMFAARYVRDELRSQQRYQLQFLDLIRLPQGISPNVRAIGEHVEYENDIWISAQILTKEVNKLVRQFAEVFHPHDGEFDEENLCLVLRSVAKATIVNSMGGERARFDQAEIKSETRFKLLEPFHFESLSTPERRHAVVDFVVEREAISFHHPLHYTLSWLIDGAKGLISSKIRALMTFDLEELKRPPPYRALVSSQSEEDYMLAAFDFPLRVYAWLAQMKAGMWVRNGLSLRHQMTTYKGVAHRDLAHHRDTFLLQTALVLCEPARVLASIIDRFGMDQWMRGNYVIRDQFEPVQQLDVAEDFIHLLIILISDRTSLQPCANTADARSKAVRHDIAHILCFKPLSFSELDQRFADKSTDLEDFQDILEEMTIFRPPEGLSDTGTFELKPEYLRNIDPYTAHYNKSQRDEAENAYRNWVSKFTGKPASEIVFEPKLQPIGSGMFQNLTSFTRSPLFAQVAFYSLFLCVNLHRLPEIPATRIEAYLHIVLHLVLIATLEEKTSLVDAVSQQAGSQSSFILNALHAESHLGLTILGLLCKLQDMSEFKAFHPQIRLILQRIQECRPEDYARAYTATGSEKSDHDLSNTQSEDEQEAQRREARLLKKQQALDRQAKVMAQFHQQQLNFLSSQDMVEWEDEDESIGSAAADEVSKIWRYPSGNCILCQEETNDNRLFGTFGMMIQSRIFRQSDCTDRQSMVEVLASPKNLDHSAESIRPFGVSGSNRIQIMKRGPDGTEILHEHQGLSPGVPSSRATQGAVTTGCGHLMHYSCFETYYSATQRRQQHQISRQHPERVTLKEFVCPLCKALGNTFLPIIWKARLETYPGSLVGETNFDEWLSTGVGLTVSRFLKAQEGKSHNDRLRELFSNYLTRTMKPTIREKFVAGTEAEATLTTHSTTRSWILGSAGGLWRSASEASISPGSRGNGEAAQMKELLSAYVRIRDTIRTNQLPSRFTYPTIVASQELLNADVLAKMLGQSITSAEIAQRGIQSGGSGTLLSSLPSAVLTHLRVFSETVSSYIALGMMSPTSSNAMASEFSQSIKLYLLQLFAGHPHINDENTMLKHIPPALMEDPFILLAECSVTLCPALNMDVYQFLRMCYILELVKTSLYLMLNPNLKQMLHGISEDLGRGTLSEEVLNSTATFLNYLIGMLPPLRVNVVGNWVDPMTADADTAAQLSTFYELLAQYALVFLRKSIILMSVLGGVDFPESNPEEKDKPEIDRLSNLLQLPPLLKMLRLSGNAGLAGSDITSSVVNGWIQHWQIHQDKSGHFDPLHPSTDLAMMKTLRPGHPTLFELVGLPRNFDTLIFEVTRHRCPTKGTRVEDPSLCLICGEIFCGQVLCCTKDGQGGCFRHMQKCGKNVGLFLNIRKCTVLYLHHRHGSWNLAPYLDKYGEADPGLRRGRQLILSPKRYDKLFRDVWLQQGIPTAIARKLEPENNNGGWETL